MEINKIKIGKRFRKDIGDLSDLKKSIEEIGLLHPIVIDENNTLIAGRRRLEVFKQLKRDIPVTKISIKDILKGEYDENTCRKNFVPSEAVAIWETLESKQGKPQSDSDRSQRREKAAKIVGLGKSKLAQAKQVIESADKEIIKEMDDTGNVNKAYKKVKDKEKREEIKRVEEKDIKDLTDEELFHKFNIKRGLYNIWSFGHKDTRFGDEKFGWMAPEIMFNLLYYYTNQGDTITDLFAGGGVSLDVCKVMKRKCLAYDLLPCRKDITKNDITKIVPNLKGSKLVFLDPPYWIQAEGEYSKEKTDFGNMTLKDFYSNFKELFIKLKNQMDKGSYLAFIIQGTQWKNNLKLEDHAFKLYKILEDLGFEFEQRIICPYSTEQYNAQQVNKSKEKKIILTIYRDLVVFKKI